MFLKKLLWAWVEPIIVCYIDTTGSCHSVWTDSPPVIGKFSVIESFQFPERPLVKLSQCFGIGNENLMSFKLRSHGHILSEAFSCLPTPQGPCMCFPPPPQPTAPPSLCPHSSHHSRKLSSTKLVPGAKNIGDRCLATPVCNVVTLKNT